jgi:hypothetical protein
MPGGVVGGYEFTRSALANGAVAQWSPAFRLFGRGGGRGSKRALAIHLQKQTTGGPKNGHQ